MLTKLLDIFRIALYGALVSVLLLFYQAWEKEHTSAITSPTSNPTFSNITHHSNNYIPSTTLQTNSNTTVPVIAATKNITPAQNSIHVTTDTLEADIDTVGGNITQIKLLNYPAELHSSQPFLLLNNLPNTQYLAQSGLLNPNGPDTTQGQAVYSTEQKNYSLLPNQSNLQVKLYWQNAQGVKITKIFTFQRNQYEIGVNYQINNQSSQPWDGNLYLQLLRKDLPDAHQNRLSTTATYFGAAISSPDKRFQKISFNSMKEKNIDQTITGGWAAMIQHYFVSAWVPENTQPLQYFSHVTQDGLYTIGMISSKISAQPGETITTHAKLYTGPAIADYLEQAAPGLKLTIDYGWFWFISGIIFWMMQHIYNVIGNWGWSIVIVTLIIKLMFYHLSAKSYRSMNGMKKLQP
ncbi:MAG: yidC, partial [Gammaproteobacteria bacterium]|nr:yidC [Gammaproteobacteria bacterium]